jgi:hypothetical protein
MSLTAHLPAALERAIWEGDVDWLSEHYPCECCCAEHTYGDGCPAYVWGGCRGQGAMSRRDHEAWAMHYEKFHGLTRDEFYGVAL